MSGTDEELAYADDSGMDYVTYILIMFSYVSPPSAVLLLITCNRMAFLIYAVFLGMMRLYLSIGRNSIKFRTKHFAGGESGRQGEYEYHELAEVEPEAEEAKEHGHV